MLWGIVYVVREGEISEEKGKGNGVIVNGINKKV